MRRLVVATCVALTALAGCAAPRQALGTRSSACFRSLPTARTAVHESGRFVGVRRVSRTSVLHAFPSAALPADHDFCVVGFSDDYRTEKVDHPAGSPIGKYAVVVVNMRGTSALQTFLVDKIPFRLRHR
jgi:hypothetical protein